MTLAIIIKFILGYPAINLPLGEKKGLGNQITINHFQYYSIFIGLKPLPLKKIHTTTLIQAAKQLLTNKKLHIISGLMMEKIQLENGTDNAINLIENFYK